jgi:hypothetical protein
MSFPAAFVRVLFHHGIHGITQIVILSEVEGPVKISNIPKALQA